MTSSYGNIFRETAICAGNSPGTRSFDVFFDLRLYKRLSKQSWGWWFETLSSPLCRHPNGLNIFDMLPQRAVFLFASTFSRGFVSGDWQITKYNTWVIWYRLNAVTRATDIYKSLDNTTPFRQLYTLFAERFVFKWFDIARLKISFRLLHMHWLHYTAIAVPAKLENCSWLMERLQ